MLMVEDMALLVIKWVAMFPKQVSFKKEVGVRLMSELITQNLFRTVYNIMTGMMNKSLSLHLCPMDDCVVSGTVCLSELSV